MADSMRRDRWDEHASNFQEEVCDIMSSETDGRLRRLIGSLNISKSKATMIDLGCGVGTFISEYAHRFEKIVGLEYAPRIIAEAKRRCRALTNVRWHTATVERAAKLIDTRADLTVCFNVITTPSARRRAKIFSNIAAVTKKRGNAVVIVPSIESAHLVREVSGENDDTGRKGDAAAGILDRDGARQKHFSRTELAADMEAAGFRVLKVVRIYYSWVEEGLSKRRDKDKQRPWDWACVGTRA